MQNQIFKLIERQLGDKANQIDCKIIDKIDDKNVYEYYVENGKIVVAGDCGVSIAKALYEYLKKYCNVHISWCGSNVCLPDILPLPTQAFQVVISQKYRAMYNFCTYGYSMPFWNWDRWEKEIDYIAMNGINMPLVVVGSDSVWYYALIEFGLSKEQALNFLSNPTFFPWQAMTNIQSVFPNYDEKFMEKRLILGKKIIDRMVALGMTPIQQGYTGFVPNVFKEMFPKEKYVNTSKWARFPKTTQIIPTTPLFQKFGKVFLEKQKQLLGSYGFYATDPFHESKPPKKGEKFMREVSQSIVKLFDSFDKNATLVMQSWSLRPAIMLAIPKDKLLILDIDGRKRQIFDDFYGYDYVLGRLDNFGQKTYFHGNLQRTAQNEYAQLKSTTPNIVGTGLFMEGSLSNPLYYEALFDMQTSIFPLNKEDFLANYCKRRYGKFNQNIYNGLEILFDKVYVEPLHDSGHSSVICSLPLFNIQSSGNCDFIEKPYDPKYIKQALECFLLAKDDFSSTYCYEYDVADLTRQLVSNECIRLHKSFVTAYKSKDHDNYHKSKNSFINILQTLDSILQNYDEMSLYHWLQQAQDLGENTAQSDWLVQSAKVILTYWGPSKNPIIYDYSWREWGGLIKEFYLPRWQKFFDKLQERYQWKMILTERILPRKAKKIEWRATEFYNNLADWQVQWTKNNQVYSPPKKVSSTIDLTLNILHSLEE